MALASGLLLSACSAFGIRTVEEPPFQAVAQLNGLTIRRYGPRLAAETVENGGEIDARSAGFRRLAAYIFGANRSRASIAMTAPVAQSGGPEKIAMTAPVDQAPEADGSWRIRFFMPAAYTLETLPQPSDSRVRIVTVPVQTVAVLCYTGIPSASAVKWANETLLKRLDGTAWHPIGQPISWFFDPPWTLPPLRRNEAVVAVAN